MTFTISETQFYIGIIVLLMGLQIYHHTRIEKLRKEADKLWEQLAMIAAALSMHLTFTDKETEKQKDKE